MLSYGYCSSHFSSYFTDLSPLLFKSTNVYAYAYVNINIRDNANVKCFYFNELIDVTKNLTRIPLINTYCSHSYNNLNIIYRNTRLQLNIQKGCNSIFVVSLFHTIFFPSMLFLKVIRFE